MTVDHDDDLAGLRARRAGRRRGPRRDARRGRARRVHRRARRRRPRGARPPRRPPGAADGRLPRRDVRQHQRRGGPRHPVGRPLGSRDGDLVNVDVSAELDGYWADTGASAAVGTVSAHGPPAARRHPAGQPRRPRRGPRRRAAAPHRAGRPAPGPAPRLLGDREPQRPRHRPRPVGAAERARHRGPPRPHACCGRASCWPSSRSCRPARRGPTRPPTAGRSCTPGHLSAQFEHTVVVTTGRPLVLTAAAAALSEASRSRARCGIAAGAVARRSSDAVPIDAHALVVQPRPARRLISPGVVQRHEVPTVGEHG